MAQVSTAIATAVPAAYFVGERDYVNSATIYDEILRNAPGISQGPMSDIVINYRKVLSTWFRIVYGVAKLDPVREDVTADFSYVQNGSVVLGRVERLPQAITARAPFDEAAFAKQAKIVGKSVYVFGRGSFPSCQVATTWTRQLLDVVSPLPPSRRWVPAKLEVRRPFADADAIGMEINCTRLLPIGAAKISVSVGGEKIGQFLFCVTDQ